MKPGTEQTDEAVANIRTAMRKHYDPNIYQEAVDEGLAVIGFLAVALIVTAILGCVVILTFAWGSL